MSGINKLICGASTTNQMIETVNACVDGSKALDGIKALEAIEGVTLNVTGFYAGSTVGGGQFIYDATRGKADHNGGTVIAPEAIAAWDGTSGDIATLLDWSGAGVGCFIRVNFYSLNSNMFGSIPNSNLDMSKSIKTAIEVSSSLGVDFFDTGDIYMANISITGISVDATFTGKIVPFNKSLNAFFASGGFDSGLAVGSVDTVKRSVTDAHGDTTLTRLLAVGHDYSVGDKIKIVSEDLIQTCLVSDNTRSGEWFIVYGVDGDYIFTETVLRHQYLTSPKVFRLKNLKFKLHINCDGVETETASPSLLQISSFDSPSVVANVENNGGIGAIVKSCFMPVVNLKFKNLANDTSTGRYGYGLSDISNFALVANVSGNCCRHGYTTGTGDNSANAWDYGEPYYSIINAKISNSTGAGVDTHSQGYRIKFLNSFVSGSLIAYQNRSVDTEFVNCDYSGVWYGYYGLNVTSVDGCSMKLSNCKGSGAIRTISTSSQGGGRVAIVINGGELDINTGDAVEVPLTLNDCDIEIKNNPKFTCFGDFIESNIAVLSDSNVIAGGFELECSNTDANSKILFNLLGNSSVKINGDFKLPIVNGSSARLFSSTDAANTSSVDAGIITTSGISDTRLAQSLNGFVSVTLTDSSNDTQSSSFKGKNLTATTDLSFVKSRDNCIYVQLVAGAGGVTLTSIPDGTFSGQQVFIYVKSGGDVNIPSSLSNVIAGANIAIGSSSTGVWQPDGWIFN